MTAPISPPRSRSAAQGLDELATGAHDVLDDGQPPARHLAAFSEPTRPVALCLLAHKERREPAQLGDHGRQRCTAEFQARDRVDAVWEHLDECLRSLSQQRRVRLEQVLSKYSLLVAPDLSRNSPVRCARS